MNKITSQEAKERMTCQKEIILKYLHNTKAHPSAEKVYLKVRKKLPHISQGTVYRVLSNLKEKEEIIEIPVAGISRFDGDISLHSHFICQKCDNVFDVFDACARCDILKRKRIKVGKINQYKVYFYGICKHCKNIK